MTNPSKTTNSSLPLGTVFFGFAITVVLTQLSIWLPVYLLHRQGIIAHDLSWIQTALISITWTLTRLWWMNLARPQHDHVSARRNDPYRMGK